VRGDVYALKAPRGTSRHGQQGSRLAVVIQADHLPLSTWLVAPTSTAALEATFRPEVTVGGRSTKVLAEQATAIDPGRLGEQVGALTYDELRRVDAALRLVLSL